MERAGKRISQIIVRQKKYAFFQKDKVLRKMYRKSDAGKKSKKGFIAKISANNLYQRKLL
jgi:hypothetical protein